MLKATVVGADRVAATFRRAPDMLLGRLYTTTERFCLDLVTRVKQRKLSGQVLNRRTGRLSRSVHHEIDTGSGRVVGAVGTNVSYAKVHEYGGTFEVPEHIRHITQAFGRPLKSPVDALVRAHHATFPERSFLRSAYREMAPRFRKDVDRAVAAAVQDMQ